jgi:hypothetical protein
MPKTRVSKTKKTDLDKKIELVSDSSVYDFTFMAESLKQIAKSLEDMNQTLNIFAMGRTCEHVKHMPRKDNVTMCKFCGISINHNSSKETK